MLKRLLKNLRGPISEIAPSSSAVHAEASCVLNVGGNTKLIPLPKHYAGWRHALLDINAGPDVDLVCDARHLMDLQAAEFDAVYCSHNLEHYHPHDVPRVLAGFLHVLKPDGFTEIRVPDVAAVLRHVVESKTELDDVLYTSTAGPITAHDVIYGWGKEIERAGSDFYSHKRGFSAKSLAESLRNAGFKRVSTQCRDGAFELRAVAFKAEPSAAQTAALDIEASWMPG